MTPTLHELHQFSHRTIDRLRTQTPTKGKIPQSLAREIGIAESLPVLLGYLGSVRTVSGGTLAALMIADGIIAPALFSPPVETSSPESDTNIKNWQNRQPRSPEPVSETWDAGGENIQPEPTPAEISTSH